MAPSPCGSPATAARRAPSWPDRVATAPTIAREARIEDAWEWPPQQLGAIDTPTLFLAGSESPAELAGITRRTAEAMPRARVHVLEGHGHFAYRFAPDLVADAMRGWQP